MDASRQQELATIDHEIAALEARKQALLNASAAPWPKHVRLYASCDKNHAWEMGEQLGLTAEAVRLFVCFQEVSLDVEVAQDGRVTILGCGGKAVEQ
mgnify:FL=1